MTTLRHDIPIADLIARSRRATDAPPLTESPALGPVDLSAIIPREDWERNLVAVRALIAAGIRFAVGGGLAFSAYSGRWRNTKDVDLFILPADSQAAIRTVTEVGYTDYYSQQPYDRSWIYRALCEGVIVDLIWTMPNHRMVVQPDWLRAGQEVVVHGEALPLLGPEELIWTKLYVLQRDRTDWPDLLNVLAARAGDLDWNRLLRDVGADAPLLGGLLSIFGWLCPMPAKRIPRWVWTAVGVEEPAGRDNCLIDCLTDKRRASFLDTRDWFGPGRRV